MCAWCDPVQVVPHKGNELKILFFANHHPSEKKSIIGNAMQLGLISFQHIPKSKKIWLCSVIGQEELSNFIIERDKQGDKQVIFSS